jgi:WD40 repeat protein/serine/threonine protein kinase
MAARPVNHPPAEVLRALGAGQLEGPEAATIFAHLDACPECRQFAANLSAVTVLRPSIPEHATTTTPAPGATQDVAAPPPRARVIPRELRDHPQYEVLRELGRGGMGVVYLARNRLMDRMEVLKVVNQFLLEQPGMAERFLREIRSAAQLRHPNIVTAYAALQLGELLVLAMEHVEGEDLGRVVKARGPLPLVNACYYAQQAAMGLQHAFEKGLVHRDIKPGNLILAREGKRHIVKILDFGLAKATREKEGQFDLTGSRQLVGTPEYIAPEQTRDAAHADIRADVYSLGCTLYFLLSGGPPFQGKSLYELMQAQVSEQAVPLNQMRPEVPAELAAVVARMMAKDPPQRYQKPVEVAQALAPFVSTRLKALPVGSASSAKTKLDLKSDPEVVEPATLPFGRAPAASNWQALVEEGRSRPAPRPRKGLIRALFGAVLLPPLDAAIWLTGSLERLLRRARFGPRGTNEDQPRPVRRSSGARTYDLTGGYYIVQFAAEGPRVVLRHNDEYGRCFARVYDLATGQALSPCLAHESAVSRAAFSPDGQRVVTAGMDGTARVWDATSGRLLGAPPRHSAAVTHAAFSPEGKRIVTASADGTARVWHAASGESLTPPLLHARNVNHAAFNPDGDQVVTASGDGMARIWNAVSGEALSPPLQHAGPVWQACFSPDGGRVATAAADGTARIWDVESGKVLCGPLRHDREVLHVSFSADGNRVVTAASDGTARVWDAVSGLALSPPLGHEADVSHASFNPDGTCVVTAGYDKAARLWDAWSGRPLGPGLEHGRAVVHASFSPDGRRVVTSSHDGTARLWDVATGRELKRVVISLD